MEVKPGKIIYVTDRSRANLKTELLTSSSTTNPTSSAVKTTATGGTTTYVRIDMNNDKVRILSAWCVMYERYKYINHIILTFGLG